LESSPFCHATRTSANHQQGVTTQLKAAFQSSKEDLHAAQVALAELKAFKADQDRTNRAIAALHTNYDRLAKQYDDIGVKMANSVKSAGSDLELITQKRNQLETAAAAIKDGLDNIKIVAGGTGPDGPSGKPGPAGPPGKDGTNGAYGMSGGNWLTVDRKGWSCW
jgi:hypothetical protein